MFYVVNFLGNISHWIIVCFSVDRFIAVIYPLQSIRWLTTRKTKVCIAILCAIAFTKNLHYLWTTDFFYNNKTGAAICAFGLRNKASWVPIYQSFEVTISSFLPFLIIVFCNVMIIKNIKRRIKNTEKLTKSDSEKLTITKSDSDTIPTSSKAQNNQQQQKNYEQYSTKEKNNDLHLTTINETPKSTAGGENNSNKTTQQRGDQNITKILLLVSTVFIITTCPLLIFRLYFAKKDISKTDLQTQAWYWLGHHICHKLWYTNNGINFFLYCWFSKSFRKDLKQILCKRKQPTVHTLSTTGS